MCMYVYVYETYIRQHGRKERSKLAIRILKVLTFKTVSHQITSEKSKNHCPVETKSYALQKEGKEPSWLRSAEMICR